MEEQRKGNEGILRFAARAERLILVALLLMLLVVVAVGALELVFTIAATLLRPSSWESIYGTEALFRIFEFFFVVLIGVELLETVRMYLEEDVIHVEIVLLVAITAVARKVIVLDLSKYEPLAIVGLALLAVSLCGGYFLLKRAVGCIGTGRPKE